MRKQRIKLRESQLKNLIENEVKKALNEVIDNDYYEERLWDNGGQDGWPTDRIMDGWKKDMRNFRNDANKHGGEFNYNEGWDDADVMAGLNGAYDSREGFPNLKKAEMDDDWDALDDADKWDRSNAQRWKEWVAKFMANDNVMDYPKGVSPFDWHDEYPTNESLDRIVRESINRVLRRPTK